MKGLLLLSLCALVVGAPCFNITDPDEAASMANARLQSSVGFPMECSSTAVTCDDFFGNCTVINVMDGMSLYLNGQYLRRIFFPSMQRADDIFIDGFLNPVHTLQSVEFPSLQRVNDLRISGHEELLRIDFPALSQRAATIDINGNSKLTGLEFPALSECFLFSVMQCPALSFVDLSVLRMVDRAIAIPLTVTPNTVKMCPSEISIIDNGQSRQCGFPQDRLCVICQVQQNTTAFCVPQCGTPSPTLAPTLIPTVVLVPSNSPTPSPTQSSIANKIFCVWIVVFILGLVA